MAQSHEDFSRTHQVKTSSNRGFGWVMVVVFLILALWPLVSGEHVRWWAVITSAAIAAITLVAPTLLALPNRLWTRFGMLLHRVVSPVVLGVMFYVVVTPMGLIMRLVARRPLRLNRDSAADTYWINRTPPGPNPESMPHQF